MNKVLFKTKRVSLQSSELSVSTEKVKWAARQMRIRIVQRGENKGTDESFGGFKSQVLTDTADVSDFHVSRRADS